MAWLRLTAKLRFENDEIQNTWFSTGGSEPDIQVHMDREVYIALGSPPEILVTLEPVKEEA